MAVQPGLCRTWSETPKTGFLSTRLNYYDALVASLSFVSSSLADQITENSWECSQRNFIPFRLTNVHLYDAVICQVSDSIMLNEEQSKPCLSHVQNSQLNKLLGVMQDFIWFIVH